MGANLEGMGGCIPPIIRLHPPNIFMLHISELDDLFFWSPLHFGQKIGHLASDDLFFGLHFIALHCHGQKFGQPRWDVKFAKLSSPHSQKIAKNDLTLSIDRYSTFCLLSNVGILYFFFEVSNIELFFTFSLSISNPGCGYASHPPAIFKHVFDEYSSSIILNLFDNN